MQQLTHSLDNIADLLAMICVVIMLAGFLGLMITAIVSFVFSLIFHKKDK